MDGAVRIGIDLGGTKIAAIALDLSNQVLAEHRVAAPRHDYAATIAAICSLVEQIKQKTSPSATVGIGTPGSISPQSGLMQNANSTWLNEKPFLKDVEAALGGPVRMANDADCFALSEATDGAGAGKKIVFGVIIGTGCGGGLVIHGRLASGPHATAGEWGHTPLPWMTAREFPGPVCWCGRPSCLETWVSGPGLAADHQRRGGDKLSAREIAGRAAKGDQAAQKTLALHASRLARGLAMIVNVIDPEIIVLGGGLSQMEHLYEELPGLMAPWIFSDTPNPQIAAPRHGDASGVRGAAWLWNE
jgi:fructokinase